MHIRARRWLTPALLLLLGFAPVVLAGEAADRAAIEAAAQAFSKAFNARDADAMTALTTEDVVLLDPEVAPISGQKAARAAWQKAVGAAQARLETATKEIAISGDVAWRIGALTHRLPSGEIAAHGQSLEIWRRENGAWKMHRQMSSTILARPQLVHPVPSQPVLDKPEN